MSATTAPSRARTGRRGALGWIALVMALALVALVGGSLVYGGYQRRAVLDPDSAGPDGTRALVRVLEQQGVRVTIARDRAAAARALAAPDATLVMRDAPMLSDAALRDLAARARHTVLVEPRSRALDVLMNGSSLGGIARDEAVAPACEVPAARRAGDARATELLVPGIGVTGCYPVDGEFALLTRERDGRTVTALDGLAVLTNAALPLDGDAALAIGVLGQSETLVWYVPSPSDADEGTAAPTLAELTPSWVTPSILLLLTAALAAAIWRGRRFGPLVTERLPVTVRANETTEGRARLYAASGDAAHALGELRRAARVRLGRLLGLAAHAPAVDVADAVADRLRADRFVVRGILVDDIPRTDRELVAAADRLRDLEASVRAAVRTEGTTR
ncbi:DUF4350 domain-containing protein [Microbacterium trichothecenolyticum]|uniref:DUF4350 domain-containing protein n=1 Tax=Microbacterium trichothecenolyticum TaxID=69370 RepID=A0ABU0TTE5_MICTR|nr:DUF4350 domain-containing protein [Microbacterium trichothecenolyticum]MDQ1122935.1 hypothetical protein [Microbacterium trichothecenolyticum]